MSDAAFEATPAMILVAMLVTLLPLSASVALGVRTVRGSGRLRLIAAAGLAIAAVYAVVLLVFAASGGRAVLLAVRGLLAGVLAAWLWTAWASPGGRWLDAAVLGGPAAAGLLAWLTADA